MAEASYFHSTLFTFQRDDFNEVIKRFKEAVPDVSARSWYDVQKDTFCLTCTGGEVGSRADGVLGELIDNYITEEPPKAEREGRAPNVRPFFESCFGEIDAEAATLTEPTIPSHAHRLRIDSEPLILHFVHTEQTINSSLKLFRLGELPDGFVERTLAPPDAAANKVVRVGSTCRAVQWDPVDEQYIFNGRYGAPIGKQEDEATNYIFDSTTFNPLSDQRRKGGVPDEHEGGERAMHWRFKDYKPSISQFLEGMAETVPLRPDMAPEKPADGELLTGAMFQALSQSRTRVAKAMLSSSNSSDDESDRESGEVSDDEASQVNFNGILRRTDERAELSKLNLDVQPVDMQEIHKDHAAADDEETTPRFQRLFGKHKRQPSYQPGPPVMTSTPVNTRTQTPYEPIRPPAPNTTNHSSKHEEFTESSQSDNIPMYSRKYAKVDNYGLTSIAPNQAAWEHENPSPRRSRPNKSGITRRQPSQFEDLTSSVQNSGSSVGTSISAGPVFKALHHAPTPTSVSPSALAFTTNQSYIDGQSGMEPWVKKVVHDKGSTNKLIDDSSPQSKASTKLPPGLEPIRISNYHPTPATVSSNAATSIKPSAFSQTIPSSSQDLVDVSENAPVSTRPRAKPPVMAIDKPMHQKSGTDAAHPDQDIVSDDDQIVERLQLAAEAPPKKRNTMRQKKGKGKSTNAKKKTKTKTPKVELPKPDPVPPPKHSDAGKAAHTTSNPQTNASKTASSGRNDTSRDNDASSSDPPEQDNDDIARPLTAVEKLVQDVTASTDVSGAEMEVSFGLILLCHDEKKLVRKNEFTKSVLQTKLREADAAALHTSFFPRMTTTVVDAYHLLDLVPGTHMTSQIIYEIHVKNSEGGHRIIKFDQAARDDAIVHMGNDKVGTLFVHCPLRVWDARVTINKPEIDLALMEPATVMASSIQTAGEAPSFYALNPSAAFTVERVHAKRVFAKRISKSMEFHVTEVRDLLLESVNSARYNIKATSLSTDAMVEAQRLWWECGVRAEHVDNDAAAQLQGILEDLVPKMDGVGFSNRGPWQKDNVEKALESTAEQWFW